MRRKSVRRRATDPSPCDGQNNTPAFELGRDACYARAPVGSTGPVGVRVPHLGRAEPARTRGGHLEPLELLSSRGGTSLASERSESGRDDPRLQEGVISRGREVWATVRTVAPFAGFEKKRTTRD
jgi:hypothetical protein